MSKKDAVVKNDPKSQEKWYNTHIYVYTNTYTYIWTRTFGFKVSSQIFQGRLFFFLNTSQILCVLKPPPWSNTVRNEWITQFVFNFFPCNVTWFLATNLSCYSWFCQFACLWGFGPADPAHWKRLPAVLLSALTSSNQMYSRIGGSGSWKIKCHVNPLILSS